MKKKTTPTRIDQLTLDPNNRRRRTPRGRDMIVRSLKDVGAARSIVLDERNVVLAGNGVVDSAAEAGISKLRIIDANADELIAVRRTGLNARQKRDLAIFDNRTSELAEWDLEQFAVDLKSGEDLGKFFSPEELDTLLERQALRPGRTDPDAVPAPRRTSIEVGHVIALGPHRLVCGDTTNEKVIAAAVNGRTLAMKHADPPYGMGKEAEGIANDNLYDEKLDAFQMLWWLAWTPSCAENSSAYIWGNAPDLWRLWWRGGLGDVKDLMVRNEIVWDKGSGFGMSSEQGHSYPPATERCLFLMRGQQFLGNQNKEDYYEGYEPLRSWLEAERDKAGWTSGDINRITDSHMAGHWFSKSQFAPISRAKYEVLQKAAKGRAFKESYDHLFDRLFGAVKSSGNAHRRELSAQLRETRTFFDNAHDKMTDVWNYSRVVGAERFGHATPKPVAMVARAIRSSCPVGGAVGIPFGGTCPEIIAAEQLERRTCAIAEIEPQYCQVIVDRWEAFTGEKAKKIGDIALKTRKRA